MAVENFLEMRDKVANPNFQLRKWIEQILQREFPLAYRSRYSLVTFTRVPYFDAFQTGFIEDEILSELCHELENPNEVDLKRAATLIR